MVFLIAGLIISIPMIYLFGKAGRELMKEPPPNPPSPADDQRNKP